MLLKEAEVKEEEEERQEEPRKGVKSLAWRERNTEIHISEANGMQRKKERAGREKRDKNARKARKGGDEPPRRRKMIPQTSEKGNGAARWDDFGARAGALLKEREAPRRKTGVSGSYCILEREE